MAVLVAIVVAVSIVIATGVLDNPALRAGAGPRASSRTELQTAQW
jgi:hypothetical protein